MLVPLVIILATLTGADRTPPSGRAESDLTEAVKRLGDRLDQLTTTAEPPLFKRHLISVNALVHSEVARAMLYSGTNPKAAEETLSYVRELAKAYSGDAAQWATYLEGRRALILARLSGRDGTLQFYNELGSGCGPLLCFPLIQLFLPAPLIRVLGHHRFPATRSFCLLGPLYLPEAGSSMGSTNSSSGAFHAPDRIVALVDRPRRGRSSLPGHFRFGNPGHRSTGP